MNREMFLYSVMDHAAGYFSKPISDASDASALRNFTRAVNDSNKSNQWFTNPEDFSLYLLAKFDPISGDIEKVEHRKIVTASAVKRPLQTAPELIDELGKR